MSTRNLSMLRKYWHTARECLSSLAQWKGNTEKIPILQEVSIETIGEQYGRRFYSHPHVDVSRETFAR